MRAGPGERAAGELSQHGEHARLTRPAPAFSSLPNQQRNDEGVRQVEGCRGSADGRRGSVQAHGVHGHEVAADSMLPKAVKQDVGLEVDGTRWSGDKELAWKVKEGSC